MRSPSREGCPVVGGRLDEVATGLRDAAQVASGSDICIAVLGDRAGLFGGGTSGEGCDAVDLRPPRSPGRALGSPAGDGNTGRARAACRPPLRHLPPGRPSWRRQSAGFSLVKRVLTALANVLSGRINPVWSPPR